MTDVELVNQARRGETAAFEELVRRTGRLVYARVYLECGNVHAAEDIFQDVFISAFRNLGTLRAAEGFRPWLLRIARHAMVNEGRKTSAKKRTPQRHAAEPNGEANPADAAATGEERQRLIGALRTLPEEHQQALSLRYFAGADYSEIERQMGLSNGGLRGILHRGLEMLRQRLGEAEVKQMPVTPRAKRGEASSMSRQSGSDLP